MLQPLIDALDKRRFITIHAACSITYDGRVTSAIERGDRLIIIKPDRCIIIHQPTGVSPINYMKQGSIIEIDADTIIARNPAHKETLRITIHTILHLSATELSDAQSIEMIGTEKDMSDMIMKSPALIEPGFKPLSREEHTRYGYIDVFGHDGNGALIVVECKRAQADYSAVMQLKRYIDRLAASKGTPPENIKGYLAAPSISASAKKYLEELGYAYRTVHPPERNLREKTQASLNRYT